MIILSVQQEIEQPRPTGLRRLVRWSISDGLNVTRETKWLAILSFASGAGLKTAMSFSARSMDAVCAWPPARSLWSFGIGLAGNVRAFTGRLTGGFSRGTPSGLIIGAGSFIRIFWGLVVGKKIHIFLSSPRSPARIHTRDRNLIMDPWHRGNYASSLNSRKWFEGSSRKRCFKKLKQKIPISRNITKPKFTA